MFLMLSHYRYLREFAEANWNKQQKLMKATKLSCEPSASELVRKHVSINVNVYTAVLGCCPL